ncbi:hypothetical protein DOTSEDRAFT_70778 [Dothistroma septosporum NZE10]|uniref:Uncharacterized protein n=1 Tax=Dothistroma septosporum (strain NZE10 / CBS 128990) TaxID=675120 RepID=N1PN27_DOTSN|nr:hypothetical protein DOTSEDRAFT_70778 [Dothistroma septosporum NZE10]
MADDFDFEDGGILDMDDGWFYVEDDIELADELAEGQLPDPGYPGNNYENDVEGFEFDVYAYWDDLEYGDHAEYDYGVGRAEVSGTKRKHTGPKKSAPDKRRKTSAKGRLTEHEWEREDEPVLFHDLRERYERWRQDPPLLKERTTFTLLPDWKTRFAAENGLVKAKAMPAAMKQAAEGEEDVDDMEDDEDGEEEDWEDEQEDGLDMEAALKAALQAKLSGVAMNDVDLEQFTKTMMKMMSGEGGDEAAAELASALLSKVASDTGDEALSGWLSGQGVSLEKDDEVSSVSTSEQSGRIDMQNSPVDSAVGASDSTRGGRKAMQMPLHSSSPVNSTKKRSAPASNNEYDRLARTQKKVKFDVPSSSSDLVLSEEANAEPPTSDDPLASGTTVKDTKRRSSAVVEANEDTSEELTSKSRKRKAAVPENFDTTFLPAKRTRKRELDDLEPLPDAPSPAPPAKRTRSARLKSGK